MPTPLQRTKISIRRLSFFSLIKISFLGFLGFAVCFFLLCGLIALLAPGRINIAPGFTGWNLVGTVIIGLTLWPAIFGVTFGCGAWVAFSVKSFLSPTEIEIIQSAVPPGTAEDKPAAKN
jgi:hypothetical protein